MYSIYKYLFMLDMLHFQLVFHLNSSLLTEVTAKILLIKGFPVHNYYHCPKLNPWQWTGCCTWQKIQFLSLKSLRSDLAPIKINEDLLINLREGGWLHRSQFWLQDHSHILLWVGSFSESKHKMTFSKLLASGISTGSTFSSTQKDAFKWKE